MLGAQKAISNDVINGRSQSTGMVSLMKQFFNFEGSWTVRNLVILAQIYLLVGFSWTSDRRVSELR